MFKKVSPNCHLSSVGVLELSKVQRVSAEGNGTCLVRDDSSHFIKDFPPVEHFSLENQLSAGVPLKEVNSVVFDSSELSEDLKNLIDKELSDDSQQTTNE